MRTWGCLGVVLHGENGQRSMPHALKGLVVKVDVRYLDLRIFDRLNIDTKAVVLGRDLDVACQKILYRMVRTTVTKFQFICFTTKGKPQKLMAQADSKNGIIRNQPLDVINSIGNGLGVPGAIGKQDAIRVHGSDFLGVGMSWNNRHLAPPLG